MTALDIIFILLVGLGLVFGLMRGFVHEVLSLGIWIAVVAALWLLHGPVSGALEPVIGTTSGAYMLAFALIFLVVLIGGKLIVRQIGGVTRRSRLGALDRILGGGFGALKGLLGVALFYMAFSLVYDTIWGRDALRPDWVAQAQTYRLVHSASDTIVNLVDARRNRGRPAADAGNEAEPSRR
ncbi:CvpA family protein [Sphingosinicella sp. YJ22]|uniref:CvpA family protein n=1 Tax=Sphingosinicella sp. YJ22 TaxID=1104780 RepID=UPI0014095233|nr:CvpA family protein [Sphingosinicella sp. YJ22]